MTELTTIDSQYIRAHYGWDYEQEIKFDILENNLESAEYVLSNLDKFPKADVPALEERITELTIFLAPRFILKQVSA